MNDLSLLEESLFIAKIHFSVKYQTNHCGILFLPGSINFIEFRLFGAPLPILSHGYLVIIIENMDNWPSASEAFGQGMSYHLNNRKYTKN